jgi:hypothetical protein
LEVGLRGTCGFGSCRLSGEAQSSCTNLVAPTKRCLRFETQGGCRTGSVRETHEPESYSRESKTRLRCFGRSGMNLCHSPDSNRLLLKTQFSQSARPYCCHFPIQKGMYPAPRTFPEQDPHVEMLLGRRGHLVPVDLYL